jgi:16S rRNA pseudouridine516 synthase
LNNLPVKRVTDLIDTFTPQVFEIDNEVIPYEKELYLVLNKPRNFECTSNPSEGHNAIFDIFPKRYMKRKEPLLCCGRLDADTTGLLLFSTSGQFVHLFQSMSLSKTYLVTARHPITQTMIDSLVNDGVTLKDGIYAKAEKVDQISEKVIQMTILTGAYHQVKRMVSAVGNRVESLSRIRIGDFELTDLREGQWRSLTPEELKSHFNWTNTYTDHYEKSNRPPILEELK